MKHASSAAVTVWGVLLAGVLTAPWLLGRSDPGDDLIRNTVRLSLAFYAAAAGLMLFLRPAEWAATGRGILARWCWSLAWAAYLVHLAMAFHFYHHWSHDDAIRHTEDVSGFGPGIYVSHLYTLLWTLDVAWWWSNPHGYATRQVWIGRVLHSFMAFIIFNGTVVYEKGPIRVAGIALFATLASVLIINHRGQRAHREMQKGI